MLDTAAMMQLYKENMGKLSSAFKKPTLVPLIPTARRISFPHWHFVSELPTAVRRGAKSLKGSHRMGNGQIFLKTSAPLSLTKAFRMNLISAGYILLDSTFV
jgi:hypothetical protein